MARISVTENDLLDALSEALPSGKGPDDARTVREMAKATGWSEVRVRKALVAVQEQGRLVVHRVGRQGIDGRAAVVSAYTIVPEKAKRRA